MYILTVTNQSIPWDQKRGIFVSARVHPGETNASWMMKGFLDFLLGDTFEAKILRDNFVFKVIPMINPDGVINGNYRCSLAGVDLNRKYIGCDKFYNPEVWYAKEECSQFYKDIKVCMIVDLHGHSRK